MPGDWPPLPCPEGCGGQLVLKASRFRHFYGCTNFPSCRGSHGAHPDGRPLGVPADAATKRARIAAHDQLDQLWKGPGAPMRRGEAYRRLADHLGLKVVHVGEADADLCQRIEAWARQQLARKAVP